MKTHFTGPYDCPPAGETESPATLKLTSIRPLSATSRARIVAPQLALKRPLKLQASWLCTVKSIGHVGGGTGQPSSASPTAATSSFTDTLPEPLQSPQH